MQNQKCVSWKYLISRMWHKVFINRMWNIILNISKDPWFQNLHLVCLNLWLQISEVSPNHLLTTQCPVTRSPARCWQSTSLVAAVTYANVMAKVHTVKRRFTLETLPRCLLSCSSVRPEHLTNTIAFNPRNNRRCYDPCARNVGRASWVSLPFLKVCAWHRQVCYLNLWGEQGLVSPKARSYHTFFPAPNLIQIDYSINWGMS